MAPLRPPDPPNMMGSTHSGMKVDSNAFPPQESLPPTEDGANGVALFMTRIIADPGNYTSNGDFLINKTLIELIQILIRTEQKRDNRMQALADRFASILSLQQANSMAGTPHLPARPQLKPTYADKAAPGATQHRPSTVPSTKEDLKMLRPGRAVIHSNPLNNQVDKLPKVLFVQRANEALAKMNARVNDELVTVTGAQVMNSGDVVFYTKNKIHQKGLMDSKHI